MPWKDLLVASVVGLYPLVTIAARHAGFDSAAFENRLENDPDTDPDLTEAPSINKAMSTS